MSPTTTGKGPEPPQSSGMHDLGRYRRACGPLRAAYRVRSASSASALARARSKGLTFLQISDSHVGFDKPANPNTTGTLEEAMDKVKALPARARPS